MKKLLTILCLCLTLCLLCCMAMAEDTPTGEETPQEKVYTRYECVDGLPGILRCFYGEDEEGNELYDDRTMTAEELKNDAYHQYEVDWNKEVWGWDGVQYNVDSYGQHAKNEAGNYEVTAPAILSRKCTRCGNVDTIERNVVNHIPVEGTDVLTPATCVAPEKYSFVCAICGDHIEYEQGDPNEMNHSWEQAVDEEGKPIITKATCEKPGKKTLECSVCGATKEMEIAPRDHQFGDEVIYKWDFKNGTVSAGKECQNTEATDEYEACEFFKIIETVGATGKLVNEEDCTEGRDWESDEFETEGLEKQTAHEELTHKFGDPAFAWEEDYSKATATHECEVCGTKETETVDAVKTLKEDTLCTAADKVTYTATFTEQWIKDWAEKNADAYKAATIKVMAGEHSYAQVGDIEWSKDNSKATLEYKCTEPTCPHSQPNDKGKYQLKTIDTVKTEDSTVPCDDENRVEWKADFSDIIEDLVETKNGALEHDWDKPVIEKKGANCEDVNVMVKWCKHCRLVSVRYEEAVAPVYADEADETIVKKILNEQADGSYCYEEETTEVFYCQNCGGFHWYYYSDGYSYRLDEYPEHIKKVVTSKLVKEHDFELKDDDENSATCTEGGSLTYVCKVCGFEKTEEVDALGHTWGEWTLVHKTGENGNELAYWTRNCEVCGEIDPLISEKDELTCEDLNEDHTFAWTVIDGAHVYRCSKCGVVENKEIPEDVHTWSEEPEIIEATCLIDGKKVWTCEDCGLTKEEVIKAVGKHTPGKEQTVKAVTCEEDGLIAITCTKCSEVLETKTVPATGHEAGDPIVTAATCTADGKEEIKCAVCGETISSKVIPAPGHIEEKTEGKAATCTEDGYTESIKCSVCGEVIKAQEVIKAEGHKSDEGTIIKEATPDEKGLIEYKCTVCGEVLKTEEYDFTATADPKYDIEATFSATGASGTVTHDPTTKKASPLYARVTVWVQNGDDLSYIVLRDKVVDGTFDVGYGVSGNVVGITVVITSTPDCASKPINSLGNVFGTLDK